ncbi:MAG: glycosyltransferase, partial [Deltaproteobacteria bacterium]|nr:glycosyltransferase [Deltaproteobacteria bacterium]
MHTSVIIISKDELPRLRLCLIALSRQALRWGHDAELVLVDDGSAAALAPAVTELLPLRSIRHERALGRSAARNAGARVAQGDRLLFLDGDVLMSPDALERHARLGPLELGRGEQRHLRSTRFFADPRTGEPWPGKEARVKSLGALAPQLVTEEQARGPFEPLLARSEVAIYPGAGPRKLYELEMGALTRGSTPRAAWMAAAGHNFSIPRALFEQARGFDEALTINEHRELALRLQRLGARVVPVPGAVSLHLTHREGWRDPLQTDDGWLATFTRLHPFEAPLMTRLWRTLANDPALPASERLGSLEDVERLLEARA